MKNAARELYTWSQCKHKNIVPLLGLAVFRDRLTMVSPWMPRGNLSKLDQRKFVGDRCTLCVQVCEGLVYLHGQKTVHGDLKGANILLSNDGIAKITDFGNTVLEKYDLNFTETSGGGDCSPRWAAPEVIEGAVQCSEPADVYALGMTILEIVSGQLPYAAFEHECHVIYAVMMRNAFPERPECIRSASEQGDVLWSTLESCWSLDPEVRPTALAVKEVMKHIRREDLV
ncbi:kinase-like protein [Ceratobasidium sp. AG-I]|nr:kinase-like protein [Ceratobasidium sp. AG-I]